MKINSNTHHDAFHLPSLTHSFEAIRSSLGQFGSKLLKGTSYFVTQMQIARMQSVLNEMTDTQLAKIDLKRNDIRKHAEFLVTGKAKAPVIKEYDGL